MAIPLACSTACPKGQRVFHGVQSGNITICLCSLVWNSDHAGVGYVTWDPDEVISMAKPGSTTKLGSLWFRCGDQGQKAGGSKPSWEVEAFIGFDELVPGGQTAVADKLMIGFIQTVESLEWEATYEDGWGRKATVLKARDAATSSVTAPWYADPKSGAKGAPFPLDDAGNNHPMLADEPMAKFSAAHPDADGWCKQIREVHFAGKFHLWLIAWDTRLPLDVKNLVFLYYTAITLDKKWTLSGTDPFSLTNWNATGQQSRSGVTTGQGSVTPILTTPVANANLTFGTHKKGTACPKKATGSAAPRAAREREGTDPDPFA